MFTFILRRGTAIEWVTTNRILENGEPGYETNTKKLKIGDGVTPWNFLPYFNDGQEITPLELDEITNAVMLEMELPDLTLLWENAKA